MDTVGWSRDFTRFGGWECQSKAQACKKWNFLKCPVTIQFLFLVPLPPRQRTQDPVCLRPSASSGCVRPSSLCRCWMDRTRGFLDVMVLQATWPSGMVPTGGAEMLQARRQTLFRWQHPLLHPPPALGAHKTTPLLLLPTRALKHHEAA